MNIIDDRDKRTIYRKLKKQQYDALMTLSTAEKWVRLLDEGMVTYQGGEPWFYITKGTLRDFVNSLAEDYVGSINIGHTDLATFPDRIVGSWTKDDLRLVDLDDGRQALDVRLRLIEEHPLVKALRLLPFELGVSAEFYTHVDDVATENETINPYHVPVIDRITITDFAIVGDAGNVNSMGIHLKGENVDIKELTALLDNPIEDVNDILTKLQDEPKKVEELIAEEPKVEEPKVEVTDEEPKAEEPKDETEEPKAEEVTDETEAPKDEAEEPKVEVAEETEPFPEMAQIAASIEEMQKEIESLKNENASLRQKLSAKENEWKTFSERFSKLAFVNTDTVKPITHKSMYTDGLGE